MNYMIKRKILMITRHGVKEAQPGDIKGDESLKGASVLDMYHQAKVALNGYVTDEGIDPRRIFIRHSPSKRTLQTANSRVAGAFALHPVPSSSKTLDSLIFSAPYFPTRVDHRLGYEGLELNEEALKKEGDSVYVTRFMGSPDRDTYDGVPVTSFNQIVRMLTPCLSDALRLLTRGPKDLGVLATHGGLAESIFTAAVNSARSTSVAGVEDIGGPVPMEGYALFCLDETDAGSCQAKMVRNGQEYPINLDRLVG